MEHYVRAEDAAALEQERDELNTRYGCTAVYKV